MLENWETRNVILPRFEGLNGFWKPGNQPYYCSGDVPRGVEHDDPRCLVSWACFGRLPTCMYVRSVHNLTPLTSRKASQPTPFQPMLVQLEQQKVIRSALQSLQLSQTLATLPIAAVFLARVEQWVSNGNSGADQFACPCSSAGSPSCPYPLLATCPHARDARLRYWNWRIIGRRPRALSCTTFAEATLRSFTMYYCS